MCYSAAKIENCSKFFWYCLFGSTGTHLYGLKTMRNVGCVIRSPDGTCILTCSNDNCLRIFNLPDELYYGKITSIPEMVSTHLFSVGQFYNLGHFTMNTRNTGKGTSKAESWISKNNRSVSAFCVRREQPSSDFEWQATKITEEENCFLGCAFRGRNSILTQRISVFVLEHWHRSSGRARL